MEASSVQVDALTEGVTLSHEGVTWEALRCVVAAALRGVQVRVGDEVQPPVAFARAWPSDKLPKLIVARCGSTMPAADACTVTSRTRVTLSDAGGSRELEPAATPSAPLPAARVAGVEDALATLRELVVWPLSHKSAFTQLGLAPHRGALLHGPPGVGKTALTRAVVAEAVATADVHLTVVDGAEVLSATVGESEARLRAVFDAAHAFVTAPGDSGRPRAAVVFLDEVDVLCPKRDGAFRRTAVQARVVAQLLTLLDGVGSVPSGGHLVVIAATNHPHSIDPALRRPGRLDKEIAVLPPGVDARRAILQLYTERMPTAADVPCALDALAADAVGYVGADLAALCREALLDAAPEPVTAAHLRAAFVAAGVPAALRGVAPRPAATPWSAVGGLPSVKHKLAQAVEWPLKHPGAFARLGLHPPKGILLHGPPGCSKTTLVAAAATAAGASFLPLSGADVYSPYVGDAEAALRAAFRKARAAPPAIVFLDEIDAMVGKRGIAASAASEVSTGVLATLLTEMDGVERSPGVLVVAATNRLDALDPALLRPGRFELRLHVPLPDASARTEILIVHTHRMPLGRDVDLAAVSAATAGLSGAQLEAICRNAAMAALRADLAAGTVTQANLMDAVATMKGGVM